MSEDDIGNEHGTIELRGEQPNESEQMTSKSIEDPNDSSHIFDGRNSNLNEENILDQSFVIVKEKNIQSRTFDAETNHDKTNAKRNNETTTTTINDIDIDLNLNLIPVEGYADEPLLPLVKACAPLSNIIQNLSTYVQLALDETSEVPPDGLTIDESAAIRLYTIEWEGPHRSLYSMLNYTLKTANREDLRPYFKYLKLFVTALVKLPCVPPLTVWRGVTKDLSAEFSPGTPVTWWPFSSCTTSLTVLENNMYLGHTGERTLFSVEAINGRIVRAHSHFDTEDEVLLLPGTHMIVQSQLSPADDLHIIHLKQIIPEQRLLEPPFEGSVSIVLIFF